jgi:hypothetical protein
MHPVAHATPSGGAERVSARARTRRLMRALAGVSNLALFAVGLYFEAHPRDRSDRWSAAAVAAVAVLNSAALSLDASGRPGERFVRRLRRMVLLLNGLLLLSALVVVALAAQRGPLYAGFHAVALLVPPLVTMLALRRFPQG